MNIMDNKHLLTISIVLLFLMLWLPLGQQDFLIDHWMKIGTFSIPFIGIGIFAFNEREKIFEPNSNIVILSSLLLLAYIIHQFEEHWIDLFGNYYAFYTFNNNFILDNLGQPNSTDKPLTKESVFVINTSLVWLVGLLGILRSPKHLFPAIAMASIVFVNGIVHILSGVVKLQYNPGLFTSIVIFIPLYVFYVRYIHKKFPTIKKQLYAGLVWAFLGHVIMVGGLLAANYYHIISEPLYFIILIAWSILPIFVFNKKIVST